MAWTRPLAFLKQLRRMAGPTRLGGDAALVCLVAVMAFLLLRHADRVNPLEGAALAGLAAALAMAARHWWAWQERLGAHGGLWAWAHRVVTLGGYPEIPAGAEPTLARALGQLLQDLRGREAELQRLRLDLCREWREVEGLLATADQARAADQAHREQRAERLEHLGRELRALVEQVLKLDQFEMSHRLQSDQHRLQGQAFRAITSQVRDGLERFEELLGELQDSFPRLRREEEALTRLADAGARQASRLGLSVRGLVAHTPRLVEETQARLEGLRRFRLASDEVRDQVEALRRRMESLRGETMQRAQALGAARGTLKGLEQTTQQAGLLAVNAAILSQQGDGGPGLATVGDRLRAIADQASLGVSDLGRALDEHHEGLEREAARLWDLQEASERLASGALDLLRISEHLDLQAHDLERALETHLSVVDQVRVSSERAGITLDEVVERAQGMEAALVRQWAVEAKLLPERDRLSRLGVRAEETGEGLARASQSSMDEVWQVLQRHHDLRRSEAFRLITGEEASAVFALRTGPDPAWNRLGWMRSQRLARLAEPLPDPPVLCRQDGGEGVLAYLLGRDALGLPQASALVGWNCDDTARVWNLDLHPALRTESCRLGLLQAIRESPAAACLPGLDLRISTAGVEVVLPVAYPAFPRFLSDLELTLPLDEDAREVHLATPAAPAPQVQCLLWVGPRSADRGPHPLLRLVHGWFKQLPAHEALLPGSPYGGPRPPCPLHDDQDSPQALEALLPVRAVGFGAPHSLVAPLLERLLAAGAVEGTDGAVLAAFGVGQGHPETLLLQLFQPEAAMAGEFHPDLVPFQSRLRDEVLSGDPATSYRAAWQLLEDLQREGWLLPLPLA